MVRVARDPSGPDRVGQNRSRPRFTWSNRRVPFIVQRNYRHDRARNTSSRASRMVGTACRRTQSPRRKKPLASARVVRAGLPPPHEGRAPSSSAERNEAPRPFSSWARLNERGPWSSRDRSAGPRLVALGNEPRPPASSHPCRWIEACRKNPAGRAAGIDPPQVKFMPWTMPRTSASGSASGKAISAVSCQPQLQQHGVSGNRRRSSSPPWPVGTPPMSVILAYQRMAGSAPSPQARPPGQKN